MDSAGFTASPWRETGNSRESPRWTWHRVTSRRASSPRVPCVYRHGKLFSRPLRVPPRPRSDLPRAVGTSVLPDGKILLIQQYRHATQQYLWELVAGRMDEQDFSVGKNG